MIVQPPTDLPARALPDRKPAAVLFGLLLAVGPFAFAGCGGSQPLVLRLPPEVKRPDRSVVLFFVDGLDRARFRALLAAGALPAIEKRLVRGGVGVENAVSSLPAMTYPNSVSLMTGCFPGHHDIIGNQWFDRRNLTWTDYITSATYQHVNQDFRNPTLYEMLPGHFTFNVQGHTHRGVSQTLDNYLETGAAWLVGAYDSLDAFVGSCIEQIGPIAARRKRWPSVITFYFPGLDEIGHRFGSDSPEYRRAVVNVDTQVRRVTDALADNGLLKTTSLVLATDHSHPPMRRCREFDLIGWLRKTRGLRIHQGPIPGADRAARARYLDRFDALALDGSHRRMVFHLRGAGRTRRPDAADGWSADPTAADVERFVGGSPMAAPGESPSGAAALNLLPCLALTCHRDGADAVRVLSPGASARIERRRDGSIAYYRITAPTGAGDDPLALRQTPGLAEFAAAGWHTSRQWLAHSADAVHPDFVPQIVEYFDSPRAGDVVVFAAGDWAFAGHDLGEHGSTLAADMLIPMYFAGPGLPAGTTIPCARLVDVLPTILDLLGERDQLRPCPPIDGRSLLPELRGGRVARPPSTNHNRPMPSPACPLATIPTF